MLKIKNIRNLSFEEIQKLVEKELNEKIYLVRNYCHGETGGTIEYYKTKEDSSRHAIKFSL